MSKPHRRACRNPKHCRQPPEAEIDPHEPSPYVEAVADEPSPAPANASSWFDAPLPHARRLPLRFMWQMDQEGRFSLGADEFARLIGPRTVAGFGRLWSEIAEAFKLDPDGRVMQAFATRRPGAASR